MVLALESFILRKSFLNSELILISTFHGNLENLNSKNLLSKNNMSTIPTTMYPELKALLSGIDLPRNEILYLHVQLNGLVDTVISGHAYTDISQALIYYLHSLYTPKAILVPTFTYSFTKTGIYDRVNTASEVGRFGEELRNMYPYSRRTMNPVFSVIDVTDFTNQMKLREDSAFGSSSLLQKLHQIGHVIVNINTPQIISTYFHYLEAHYNVDYRFPKFFSGKVSNNGIDFESINYEYYVRNLALDTKWRRDKIQKFLFQSKALHVSKNMKIKLHWFSSYDADHTLGPKICNEPHFMITN